ncbi:acyl carrier protein [Microbulbifer magnicolonia]|uniref:acyl carrier protein n=1 Tax=Microbulbifer magnicolonia TaxID=3109744 RepID=UPI002B40E137|nr:phosphopantetheine-binding protein [Microbulbifer sp. GG15]
MSTAMTREAISALTLEKLLQVAPDIDPGLLDPAVSIRDQYDFDSMDFLNFTIALGHEFEMDIPEKDYAELQSLNGAIEYVSKHLESGASGE